MRTFVDDYDVAWLNNNEAPIHANLGAGKPNYDAYGYSGRTSVIYAGFLPTNGFFHIDVTNLVAGENLIAAKVFQVNATNTDITFAYELTAIVNRFINPRLMIGPDPAMPGHTILRWDDSAGQLYESSEVDALPEAWMPVSDAAGGVYAIPATAGSRFFTIRR